VIKGQTLYIPGPKAAHWLPESPKSKRANHPLTSRKSQIEKCEQPPTKSLTDGFSGKLRHAGLVQGIGGPTHAFLPIVQF
jgi:hypothetical protein